MLEFGAHSKEGIHGWQYTFSQKLLAQEAVGHSGKAAALAWLSRHAPITSPLNNYAYAHKLSSLTRENSFYSDQL